MEKLKDLYIENDKVSAPYLLAVSFSGQLQFLGSFIENGILYWRFSPKTKAQTLLDQLHTKTEPHIPAKDLFEAIDTFWKQVAMSRNEHGI